MVNELWLNLPVKDVQKSKAFFTALGFPFSLRHGDGDPMAGLLVGKNKTAVMLCAEDLFKGFVQHTVADPRQSAQMLISIDVESREEVDELARRAEAAGGHVFGKPTEVQGWMYGCAFCDLDGHRWNVLYMDMSKIPG